MEMIKIRQLDRMEIRQIYGSYMTEAFPPDELKPLERIFEMLDDGIYECTGLFNEGHLVAYAFFVKQEERGYYLLDYLAVIKEYRSSGYGSVYMAQMKRYFADCRGIFLECESEDSLQEWTTDNQAVASQRRKRIRFYLNNGAVLTNVKSWLFGVDYSILYFPVRDEAGETDWYQELYEIYQVMFPAKVWQKRVRLWQRFGALIESNQLIRVDGEVQVRPAVSLCDALGIRRQLEDGQLRMIALVGAGGKTSTMYQLADELAEMGKRVLVTTTTHIAVPQKGQIVLLETAEELKSVKWEHSILIAGKPADDRNQRKLRQPQHLEALMEYADVVLVEADGSRNHPVKVAAEYEPVIPVQADMIIGCLGLQALGKTWQKACHRFDTDGQWLGKQPGEHITPADLAQLITAESALSKGISGRDYRVILNQADSIAEKNAAEEIVRCLPDGLVAVTCYNKEIVL